VRSLTKQLVKTHIYLFFYTFKCTHALHTQADAAKSFEVSPAVRSLTKQLATLQSVLVPILQEEEVGCICGGVGWGYTGVFETHIEAYQIVCNSLVHEKCV
jgi:hypothetical protein